jgi:hypothetical protein
LSVPLGSVGVSAVARGREGQVLRAVAAGVALKRPADALTLVKLAKEEPASVVDPELDLDELNKLLLACTRALDARSSAPSVEKRHRAVAAAVGADPVLVAAVEAVEDDAAHENGVKWVASVDASLLDRTARAGAKEKQLTLVPSEQGRLDRLEDDVHALDRRVTALEGTGSPKPRMARKK